MFEEEDIIDPAGRLSREELLQEIRHAEVQQGACRFLVGNVRTQQEVKI